jgi:hypothetical protein
MVESHAGLSVDPDFDNRLNRDPPRQAWRLTRFLWWCSGSVATLLEKSPGESGKYAGIGGAVLSTWVLASAAGGYALYTMAGPSNWQVPLGVLGGLVWGAIIFNIDRFLVSSLRKSEERSLRQVLASELLPASPRILFAVVIALTIAEPIELRLFASEIEARIEANRDQLVAARQQSLRQLAEPRDASARRELSQIDADVAASRERLERLQREYIEESDGRGGSQRVGDGPLTELKRLELQRVVVEHQELERRHLPRRALLQQQLDTTESDIAAALRDYRAALGSGYLARREALTDLYNERPGVAGAVWGIFLLMVMVEVTPILLKVLGAYGPYDAMLSMLEESEIREAQLQKEYRVSMARYHYELATTAERAIEDASFEAGTPVRTTKVRQAWANFDNDVAISNQGSADGLLRHLRAALSLHRDG